MHTPLYPTFLAISGAKNGAVFAKKRGKRGVCTPHFAPHLPPCCSCIYIGPLFGGADFGIMVWVGSHIIRQNSDAEEGNNIDAHVCSTCRLPTGSESAPKWLPKGPKSAPTARRFFLPNSPKGLPAGSKCAPSARPLCAGYRRRSAEHLKGFDTPSGLLGSDSLNTHLRHSPKPCKGR